MPSSSSACGSRRHLIVRAERPEALRTLIAEARKLHPKGGPSRLMLQSAVTRGRSPCGRPRCYDAGGMTDAAYLELLANYEAALRAATRSLTIARTLAEAHRSALRPPEVILDAYFATVERDEAQVADLREHVQRFKSR